MAVRAGNLRHRLVFQRKSVAVDGFGAEVATWAEFATVWGSAEGISGRELWAAQAEQGELITRFVTRWLEGVKVEDRVSWDGRLFDVTSVADRDGRGREMVVMGRELVE